MPAGANAKREGEYKTLETRFKKEHRYPGREDEVAARIVNKQRAQYGETRSARAKDRSGQSPDKGLPLADYETMTIPQIRARMGDLSARELRRLRTYETKHKNRKGVLSLLDKQRH